MCSQRQHDGTMVHITNNEGLRNNIIIPNQIRDSDFGLPPASFFRFLGLLLFWGEGGMIEDRSISGY